MSGLFKINYQNHSSYDHINSTLFSKIKNNLKFIIFFFISSISIAFLNKYPKDNSKTCSKHTLKFFQDGVLSFNDNNLKDFLRSLLEKNIESIEDNINKIPIKERSISDCIVGIKKSQNKRIFKKIEEFFFDKNEFSEILLSFFNNKKPKLVHFNIHVNRSDDIYVFKHDDEDVFDDDMNFFHVDTNLNTVKAMVYLTDVSSEKDGGFEYVIGSHSEFKNNYLNNKNITSVRKYKLIKDYNTILSLVDKEHKRQLDNI